MQEKRQAVQRQLQELSQKVKQLELEKAELRGALGSATNETRVWSFRTPFDTRGTSNQHLPVSLLRKHSVAFSLLFPCQSGCNCAVKYAASLQKHCNVLEPS